MELRVTDYKLPENVGFNYEELKTALTEKVHIYKTMVYGEDQIKQAKADRAELNKLDKALNEERIRLEKEYMVPFNAFKAQINDLREIIKSAIVTSDNAIKDHEKCKKEEKREAIKELFAEQGFPEYITLEKIFDENWLNSSCSMGRVKEDFKTVTLADQRAMDALSKLTEFSFEAMEFYKEHLDLPGALTQAAKLADIAKAKAAAAEERRRAAEEAARLAVEEMTNAPVQPEPVPVQANDEAREWVRFQANLTTMDALELRNFFVSRNIEFKAI